MRHTAGAFRYPIARVRAWGVAWGAPMPADLLDAKKGDGLLSRPVGGGGGEGRASDRKEQARTLTL